MKFLSRSMDDANLSIINIYYNQGTPDYSTPDDVLDIVYKDNITGKKYVETIHSPRIEIYIVKPEYRNFDYFKNFIPIEQCTKYTMPYKTRFTEIAKILGCTPKEAKYSKYICQADMNIEHYYLMQFFIEYQNKDNTKLSLGFSDIESDIIGTEGFAEPGECPPNAISYFDMSRMTMHTFVCVQDNVPHVDKSCKKYEHYEKLRKRFKEQTDYFINHTDDFIKECHENFDEFYGSNIEYKLYIFADEISMVKAYWQLVRSIDNDFLFFWNAPYDVSNLIERPKALGYDPNDIISSPEFGKREVTWHEDKNAVVHKRKHQFRTFTKVNIMDQMVNYAGIRSGKGKLPSVKLNAIAENELKDKKLDYSEFGNIKMFPYYDFWKFILYNIKDVLLQYGIERKTKDADYIYTIMSVNCLKSSDVFTSTLVVENSLRTFGFIEKAEVMGSNKNKLYRVKKTPEQIKEEKKNKFAGAFVMHPGHASSTGYLLLGVLNKYIHDHAIDFDITSEYPTGMLIMNCGNEQMVGKVFLVNPDDIDLPLYRNMYFIDEDDKDGYRKTANKSNLMMEALSENNPTAFGTQYLKLPGFSMIADHIDDCLEDFLE